MIPLCSLGDLPDPGTLEFEVGTGEWPVPAFLVRRNGAVHAYLNRCPHAGHLLNWKSDDFFDASRMLLLCNSHGALFEPDTGQCVVGPCVGQGLRPLRIEIMDGRVVLRDSAADIGKWDWGR